MSEGTGFLAQQIALLERTNRHWVPDGVLRPSSERESGFREWDATFTAAKSGAPTCSCVVRGQSVWLHSKYDPEQEAVRKTASFLPTLPPETDKVVVYGLGCGHHVRQLLLHLPADVEVEVWEWNETFFLQALTHVDLQDLLQDTRLTLRVSEDVNVIQDWVSEWAELTPALWVHQASLQIIPERMVPLRQVLENYLVNAGSMLAAESLLDENFRSNTALDIPGVRSFAQLLEGAPVLLVSAGPSLSNNIALIQKAKRHCIIGCVGTALQPLLQHRILPDFFMMTDPKPYVLAQVRSLRRKDLPLFFLSTVYRQVPHHYDGPKFLLYQKDYSHAEAYASGQGEPLLETGGSVATTLFSFMLYLGCDPLCLVGQDLAYTNNQTHAQGTNRYRKFKEIAAYGQQYEVTDFFRQGTVRTGRNLRIYLHWFERQAEQVSSRRLYNATEGGAHISGFTHLRLEEFLEIYHDTDVETKRRKFHNVVSQFFTDYARSGSSN